MFNLVDKTGIAQVFVFPETYSQNSEKIKEDKVIVGKFEVDIDQETEEIKLLLREVYTPEEFLRSEDMKIRLVFLRELQEEALLRLRELIRECEDPEGKELTLELRINGYRTILHADPRIKVGTNIVKLREKLREMGINLEIS